MNGQTIHICIRVVATMGMAIVVFVFLACASTPNPVRTPVSSSPTPNRAATPVPPTETAQAKPAGSQGTTSSPTSTPTPRQVASSNAKPTSCPVGQFLTEYFDTHCLNGTKVVVTCEDAPLDHDWKSGSPDEGIPVDLFSARWTGKFDFEGDGTYVFQAFADDGVRVVVDDTNVIESYTNKSGHREGSVKLNSGEHQVKVEYIEYSGDAVINVNWTRSDLLPTATSTPTPTPTFTPEPTASATPISCPTGQYLAQYYRNTSFSGAPVITVCEGAPVKHGWGSKSPSSRIPVDSFSARYTGRFNITSEGTYSFSAYADDGVRVWVDGRTVIDDANGPANTRWGCTYLTAGEHDVRVEFVERGGDASIDVNWSKGDETTCRLQLTPTATPTPSPTPPVCLPPAKT